MERQWQTQAEHFIPYPKNLQRKGSCINVRCDSDSFLLSVLACLRHLAQGKADNLSLRSSYFKKSPGCKRKRGDPEPEIDTLGLHTEMLPDIGAFEEANDLGVYLYSWDDSSSSEVLKRTPAKYYSREVVLFVLEDGEKHHFVACVNFQKLRRTVHFLLQLNWLHHCHRCLAQFNNESALQFHLDARSCLQNGPIATQGISSPAGA
jgi:hypothetical protein